MPSAALSLPAQAHNSGATTVGGSPYSSSHFSLRANIRSSERPDRRLTLLCAGYAAIEHNAKEVIMPTTLAGKRIAFLVAPEGAEQVELTEPWKAVQEAGGTPELVSTEVGKIQAFNHLTPADTFEADKAADSVTASEYDGLVLPGGVANPDFLRGNASAVQFPRSFFDSGRPVAAICHAAWTMIDADVVRGRMITSWPTLRTDLLN